MKQFGILFILFTFIFNSVTGQSIERVEPPNWWTGMKNPELQLLIYGKDIGNLNPEIDYPGIKVEQVRKVENPNYLFIDLTISSTCQPGSFKIDFRKKRRVVESVKYKLEGRDPNSAQRAGFDNSDVLYLITPDRFANGNERNDNVKGMKETANRDFKGGRHGGDIKGISKNLRFISDMGYTAIWLNPLLENDMEEYSYHGYSTTDFYKVDPRFGDNEAYRKLIKQANKSGMKMIMDMIVNHCGLNHWWMNDLPTKDWINQWPVYTQTNHRKTLTQDPYASEADKKVFTDGWFVPTMPDLNQRNELMATYLTQNSIWWIEYSGISGIRMDTYPYPDMNYMADWTEDVMSEYPNFSIVGEEWFGHPPIVSYWQKGKTNPNGYSSELGSLMDFPLQKALVDALNQPESFGTGWITLYEILGQDFLYADPYSLVVFPDNHDMSRIYAQVKEDYDLFKIALVFTLTTRGIPQFYYGTEILMSDPGNGDHGIIRSDFPGGWKDDAVNGFTGKGLTDQQNEAKEFVKNLLKWRRSATAVHSGKLIHFLPEKGVYTFFRFDDDQMVMVVLNKNKEDVSLNMTRFSEVLGKRVKADDIISGSKYKVSDSLNVPARSALVLEFR